MLHLPRDMGHERRNVVDTMSRDTQRCKSLPFTGFQLYFIIFSRLILCVTL
jgi:hypothetical protein